MVFTCSGVYRELFMGRFSSLIGLDHPTKLALRLAQDPGSMSSLSWSPGATTVSSWSRSCPEGSSQWKRGSPKTAAALYFPVASLGMCS